ncbi:MAG: hypothetical protein ACT4O0_08400 [Pseudonocardia sp.]
MCHVAAEGPSECPAGHQHRFPITGRVVGITLRCPSCAPRSAAEEIAQARAARRRTLAGVAALPAATRARLAADGMLAALHRVLAEPDDGRSAAEFPQ